MNQSINNSGFVDMFQDLNEDYEPYEYNDINVSLKNIYNSIQTYKAGIHNQEYTIDD